VFWPQGFAGGFDWAAALIAIGAGVALFRFGVGVLTLLGAAAVAGLAASMLGA
jgi:chromate transporter